jgi:hypothetical protein
MGCHSARKLLGEQLLDIWSLSPKPCPIHGAASEESLLASLSRALRPGGSGDGIKRWQSP